MIWEAYIMRMCQNEPNPESQIKDFRGFSSLRELGNATNGIFYSSQCWESRFLLISCFPREGKPFFADFWFSLVRESRFSPIFDFPPWRKADFRRFSFVVPLRKPPFADFRSSYPYESLLLPFFYQLYPVSEWFFAKIDDLRPYLSSFSYWAVSDCWFSKRHLCFDTASFLDCICIFLHWLQNVLYNMVLWEYILFITFASCK